jgi:glutamine---fructose-6-phosphate transaminase (isomerizing)
VHYKGRLLDPGTLLVVVSQSGRSAEILRLLEANQGRAAIVAITNTPDSPLAQQAGAVVLTRAGEEFSVSCKTYVTSMIAVQWLAAVLCAKDLRGVASELAQVAPAAERYLRSWESHVSALLHRLRGIRHMFLCGRGESLAAALTGSLIIKESTRFPAEGMSSAALRHGPLEMLGPASFVLIFAGSGAGRALNERLAKDVLDQGARAELVGDDAATEVFRLRAAPACVRPVLEILPVQMMTLALGAQAGREPGRFERASKVTTSE